MTKYLSKLNKHSLFYINKYLNLNVAGKRINAPYYMNIEPEFLGLMRYCEINKEKVDEFHQKYKNREISYGWYRGKATPQQLIISTKELAKLKQFNISNFSRQELKGFMHLIGLGIDCSGFCFNVLDYALKKENLHDKFIDSLNWSDPEKRQVNYAGVFVFSDKSSTVVKKGYQPLDLIIKKDLWHIKMLVMINKVFFTAESNFATGVSIKKGIKIGPEYEVRRLNILS